MNHNTILITRRLSDGDAAALRQKLAEMWPDEQWTIVFGELATARPAVGPSEYKDTDVTPVPRFES